MTDLPEFQTVRLALLILFTAAFFLYGWNIGRMWAGRSRPARLLAVGLLGVLGYVTAGQIKAAAYGVPVDGLTHVGIASAVAVIVALVWLQHGSRRHGGA